MNEIRVPVKLEVLQNSIGDLQKILNGLQPNTASFKAIEKIINSMVNEAQKLQAQLSKPFTNEGQFKSTNKTIDKLEESAARIQVVMNGLKFSDLKLTPDQQSSFDELNSKINEIKSNYQDFLNKLKVGVVANGNNKSLIDALPGKDMLDANFSDISSAVDKYVSELQTKVKQAEDALNKLQSNVELARRSEVLTTTGRGINKESLGEALFNKYFWQNGAGEIGFKLTGKGSGSAAFLAELEQMFHLDPGQLNDLVGKSFADINKAFQEMGQKGHLNPFEGIQKAWGKKSGQVEMDKAALADLKKDLEEYRRLQTELQTLQTTQVGPKDSATQAEVSKLEQELGKLEQRIYSTAQAGGTMRAPLDQLGSQFDYLRTQLEQTNSQFLKLQRTQMQFNQMKMAVINFMGFNQVLNLTKRAVKEAVNHIKELDTVMNKISIVTDMSTGDLWNQVDQYSKMAQAFGTTIKGAYEVSQIYYQQGLGTNDVLTLTNETLKLAKVSGLDYATTTDYMTTALRGFKMEMSEASTVVDVYSNLAAHTAVSSEELAVAMSKTASSMESVGSTFEETSAMIGTMVAVTRESAVNIGSALKSIAARYGEMKQDPLKLVDSEGDEISYNKVDAALQSVGISLKTTDGQFRSFTDVIIELSEKWDQLESTQQRYIATQFAGNRQQSRFLALVSNKDLLKANIGFAEESEDTGTLQALKALDSIESKLNQVQVAYQQFYTTMGIETAWKGFLDGAKNVINTLNSLPKLFGKLPIGAFAAISTVVSLIKTMGISIITEIAQVMGNGLISTVENTATQGGKSFIQRLADSLRSGKSEVQAAAAEVGQAAGQGVNEGLQQVDFKKFTSAQRKSRITSNNQTIDSLNATLTNTKAAANMYIAGGRMSSQEAFLMQSRRYDATLQDLYNKNAIPTEVLDKYTAGQISAEQAIVQTVAALEQESATLDTTGAKFTSSINSLKAFGAAHQRGLKSLASFGQGLSMVGMMINTTTSQGKLLSATFMGMGGAISSISSVVAHASEGLKAIPWMAVLSGAMMVINAISTFIVTPEERLQELEAKAEELTNKAKETKANYRTLETSIKKLDELKEKRYESAEAAEEYQTAVDDLADKFPQLIGSFDEAGNAILDTVAMEQTLTNARQEAAEAAYNAAKAEAELATANLYKKEEELKNKRQQASTFYKSSYGASEETGDRIIARREDQVLSYNDLPYKSGAKFLQGFEDLIASGTELNKTQQEIYDRLVSPEINGSSQKLIDSLFKQINSTDINEGLRALTLIETLFDTFGFKLDKTIQDQFNAIRTKNSEISPLRNIIEASNKAQVNAWLRKSNVYKETPFLKENTGLFQIVEKQLYDKAAGNFEEGHLTNIGEDLVSKASILWDKLNEDLQKEVDNILKNQDKYTASDLKNTLGSLAVFAPDWIYETLEKQNNDIKDNLEKHLNTIYNESQREDPAYNKILSMIKDDTSEFTLDSQKVLVAALSQITNLRDSGFDTSVIADAIITLFDSLNTLSTDARNAILKQILANGQNIEGWQKTLNYINNNTDFDFSTISIESIESVINESIPNYELIASSMMASLQEQWEDIDKFFSALTKGASTIERDNLIAQAKVYGLDIDDKFVQDEEGWIVSAENLNEIIATYRQNLRSQFESLDNDLTDAYIELQSNNVFDSGTVTRDELHKIKTVLQQDFDKYFKYNKDTETWSFIWLDENETIGEARDRLQQALFEKYTEDSSKIAEILEWYDLITVDLEKSSAWGRGDYTSLATTTKGLLMFDSTASYEEKAGAIYNRLLELAAGAILDEDELRDPDWKRGRDTVRESFSTLISDILDKGIKNIDLDDYEGFYNKEEILQDLQSLNHESFVNKYIKYAHKSIEEANELLYNAYEKDNESSSADLIKDLQFYDKNTVKLNREQLKNFSNIFKRDYGQLLKSLGLSFDEITGDALVNISDLAKLGIDLSKIDGYSEIVTESIQDLFKNIAEALNNAISGGASSDQQKSLQEFADRNGIGELHFTRTAKGAALATAEVIKLYNAIKNVDKVAAEITFEELMKTLIETNDNFESISANVVYIRDLIKKKDSEADPARRDMYEQELQLAEKILAVRSTTEDSSFNFMSNKIPAAQNNPLNYFSNWQKGWQALQEGLKSGYMDYTDFYNLFTEMGNLAEKSNEITLGAGTVLKNSEDAAKLITQAAGTLTVDEATGKLQISFDSLAQLGVDFGAAGAKMDENVTKGIQDYAKAQVEMLDGMIQMLETIVQMEQLGDVAGEDHQIDLGEILVGGLTGSDAQYTSKYEEARASIEEAGNANEEFRQGLESIIIGDKSLWQIIQQDASSFKAEEAKAINAIYQALQSDSYDKDSIVKSIQELYGNEGLDITIEDNKWTITFKDPDIEVSEDAKLSNTTENKIKTWISKHAKQAGSKEATLDEPLEVAVQQLIVKKGDSFEVSGEEDIWAEITTEKTFDFTAYITGLTADKEGNWVPSGDIAIWDELSRENKFDFIAKITGLKVEPNGELNSEGAEAIWSLIDGYENAGGTSNVTKTMEFISQITALKTQWAEGASKEPDYKEVGIKDEYTAPDATITQKLIMNWEFEGEEEALNRKATEISGLLSQFDFRTTYSDNGETRFNLSEVVSGGIAPSQADLSALREAVQLYQSLGGTRYQLQGNTIIEFAGELNTEEVDSTVNEIENEDIEIPIETGSIDDATVKAYQPESKTIDVYTNVHDGGTSTEAKGNIGKARAKGTLMGELGPELVVSKGRYFVVGQAGPEMVNLADDAIVFNHLQTESLLKKGMSKGRGKAVTNERNAVSFATGNVNGGPAKASASAALTALRQLRAEWQAIANMSTKDLASKGGGGGGGGGDPKAFLKDLERWYDWLQQIAQLEKEITLEEAKRTEYQSHMVARGKEYFTSQLASLELLQEQAVVQKSLNDSQEEYFQKRLKEINQQSAFSALYGFSESGQLYYKDVYADNKSAFEWLSDLVGRNEVTGEANYTAEEQYNKLVAAGFGFAMEYDSSGNKIKHEGTDWYNTALQAFWDKIDRDKEEMQSLHDSVEDGKKKLLELENDQNEILHEIEDNQIEVEQKVLKAIEEARQREIDELKDTKEAIENSAKEFTDGLNKQLDKERQMRDNQASADELATLQRRLSILQRSGGSASEIRDLQQQINDKQYDKYFDMQEQQIQAIQDSSDAQIERLDNQIELMEETLAYEKENGLLWTDVDEILKRSSEDIVSFIQGNTSEYWSKSTTELQKVLREDLFEVDRFKQFQATVEDGIEALIMKFGTEEQKKALADKKRAENPITSTDNSNINTSSVKSSGSGGGNNSGKKPQNKKYGFRYTFNGKIAEGEQSWDSAEKAKSVALLSINEAATRLINSKKYSSIGAVQQMVEQAKKTITAYSTGGYDYTTGLAILHGTKTRPESIFNAEQTRILREQFLSNRPDSVISLLKDYREAYHGLSTNAYDSIQNNSNATTIEHAEVNLNVDKLANDYDAKRAANTIMDEMLRIASKTSANNSVRR